LLIIWQAGEDEESMNHRLIWVAALITVAAMALQAQKHPAQSAAVGWPFAPTAKFVASTERTFDQLMGEAMSVMHKGMHSAAYSGEPDHDFVAMMIPHHQGAIDMAKALLLYGKDPQTRRLAQEIIIDQQSEIELMQLWLKQRNALKSKARPTSNSDE
jgi:uncharacterized protein (DUF305 family)